jgi:hypothetical protein
MAVRDAQDEEVPRTSIEDEIRAFSLSRATCSGLKSLWRRSANDRPGQVAEQL